MQLLPQLDTYVAAPRAVLTSTAGVSTCPTVWTPIQHHVRTPTHAQSCTCAHQLARSKTRSPPWTGPAQARVWRCGSQACHAALSTTPHARQKSSTCSYRVAPQHYSNRILNLRWDGAGGWGGGVGGVQSISAKVLFGLGIIKQQVQYQVPSVAYPQLMLAQSCSLGCGSERRVMRYLFASLNGQH